MENLNCSLQNHQLGGGYELALKGSWIPWIWEVCLTAQAELLPRIESQWKAPERKKILTDSSRVFVLIYRGIRKIDIKYCIYSLT